MREESRKLYRELSARPFIIAGPCVLESYELAREVALAVKEAATAAGLFAVFKSSYDKANRSALSGFRGPGLSRGLEWLARIRQESGLPVITDAHEPGEIPAVAETADILQIPAFLCRQTSLLLAAGASGRIVNVKKGQFLSPWEMQNVLDKVRSTDNELVLATERGTSFGYNNLVVDMRALYWMKKEGFPVVFDATHAVQRPGGLGGTTGGDSELAPVLASAAMATGSVDGVFMEVHKDPSRALSDGPNQIPLHLLEGVLKRLQSIHQAVQS